MITNTTLSNGLEVHLKEIHTAPIITSWTWYRVGSRNELPGTTGISHWVEHMQFKGTHRYPQGILDKAISREGGVWNAFTHMDWTTFFETMPADKIEIALDLEADRMVNSHFNPDEVESERTVILSEREGNENEPLFLLGEAVQREAFQTHPYRHEVIGDSEDLKRITREELFEHYQSHYHPANAVLAFAGDFNSESMIKNIEKHFGGIPVKPVDPPLVSIEPEQNAERKITVRGPGETTFIQAAYHAPQANHDDFFPFSVLDSLLTGPTGLNMFGGGGISNKTSRLYQALIEKEYGVAVHGSLQATIDPFLYTITIINHPKRTPETTCAVLDDQLERIFNGEITQAELDKAIKQAKVLFVYGAETITNQGFWLGYAEMFAHYEWFDRYIERLSKVTLKDVNDVAGRYLHPRNRTLGVYIPSGNAEVE